MSLLNQLGVQTIGRTKRKSSLADVSIFVINKKNPSSILSITKLIERENLDWEAFDIGFSRQHNGFLIARGTTYPIKAGGRVSSRDVANVAYNELKIERAKPGERIRIDFESSFFSEDVYQLKLKTVTRKSNDE